MQTKYYLHASSRTIAFAKMSTVPALDSNVELFKITISQFLSTTRLFAHEDQLFVPSLNHLYVYEIVRVGEWELVQTISEKPVEQGLIPNFREYKAVKVRNGRAIVGIRDLVENKGILLHLKNIEGKWIAVEQIRSPVGLNGDGLFFGAGFDFNENFLIVGSPLGTATARANSQGVVYVYELVDGKWVFDSVLYGERVPFSYMGVDIELTNSSLLVGTTHRGFVGSPPPYSSRKTVLKFELSKPLGKPIDSYEAIRFNSTSDDLGLKVYSNDVLGLDIFPAPSLEVGFGEVQVFDSSGLKQTIRPMSNNEVSFAKDILVFKDVLFISSSSEGVGFLHVYRFTTPSRRFEHFTTIQPPIGEGDNSFGSSLAASEDTLFISHFEGNKPGVYGINLGKTLEPTSLPTRATASPVAAPANSVNNAAVVGSLAAVGFAFAIGAAILFARRRRRQNASNNVPGIDDYVEAINPRSQNVQFASVADARRSLELLFAKTV